MIKAEVVFDGDSMTINGYALYNSDKGYWFIAGVVHKFHVLEQAIKYCLEN